MVILRTISLSLIFIGLLILLIVNFLCRKNNNYPKAKKNGHSFCFLVPARYEKEVIEDLLISIKNQSVKVNMKDVYVIIETKEDETFNICKKYNATVVLRKHVEKQRKGYALDEAVKFILKKNKKYDAYFIFDADNILDKDYLKNMIPIFDKGYDLASGYRNCKNGNISSIAACSSLTFSLVNTVFNDKKNKESRNITFSGTGFYIRGELINKWRGYPFHSLTEDYELSSYATLNNLTTYYNTKSIFYDEQPVKYKDTINQRVRWIRGYFDVRKIYNKKMFIALNKNDPNNASKIDEAIGIVPYIFMILGLVIWFLSLLIFMLYNFFNKNILWKRYFLKILLFIVTIYVMLMIMTLVILVLERNKINLNLKTKIKAFFINPIFMVSYIPCAIIALTKKNVKWTKIKHGK